MIEKVDPDGTKTTNQYSGDNLTRSQIGEEVTQYEYDAYGRQTKVIYPNGTYSTTAYQDSDLKEIEKDAKGNTTSTTYNDYGQTISEIDADGRTTSETYDPLNPEIKTSVTDGNGHKTSYVYDDNGNMTSLTNASGKTKTFTYNGNDQLLTTEFPSGQTTMKTTNTYDDNGNLSRVTENSGIVEQYSYDDVDQLTKAVIQKNGQNVLGWTNTYDDAGQVTGRTLTDLTTNTPLVQKKWTYTADNQPATFTQGNYQSASTYDENDQLSEQKFSFADSSQPFDLKQSFSYTPEGKIKSASAAETGGSSLLSLAYTYDLKQNKSPLTTAVGCLKNSWPTMTPTT
ncbi:hypothetical protein QS257_10290 [Terrilactibacillus sp. S3-3]|nr:hypothetical protein QS257_10290 [Terrilactibacillus sp. S3-3]